MLAGCDRRVDRGPVVASVIGAPARLGDAARGSLSPPAQVMNGAVAQGLVRFDATGQIEPGIAESWIVIDGGMSYIFRLREASWPDGRAVTSTEVAAALRRQIAPHSRNPLAPFLSAIEEIVAMTPEVVEIRLARPRPDLLKLFAQPELAILRTRPPAGSGPFRIVDDRGGTLLRPVDDPERDEDDDTVPHPEQSVQLIAERAALAVARFAGRRSDLVTGGSFADWPLVVLADVARAEIRVDPAAGLFGFAVTDRDGFLADLANRTAIVAAFDRTAMLSAIDSTWAAAEQIVPDTLDSAAGPASPSWVQTPIEDRQAAARARVAAWRTDHPEPLVMRVALPTGPGATLLWGQTAATLARIGIVAVRVPADAPAELRLVDAVAPYDSARWYLVTACQPCGEDAQAKLDAARLAPTIADRAQAIAAADQAVAADASFIILARPWRWSLVAPRLAEWQPNARAWHPLNHLRIDTR